MLPVYTYDQIAFQLTDAGQEYFGDIRQSFDISRDNIITYDVSALNEAGRIFARAAFDAWTAASGLRFEEQRFAPDIDFSHGTGFAEAYATTNVTFFGEILDAEIVITRDFYDDDWRIGPNGQVQVVFGSEGFSTFVHEIGHALGLAHAGNYNGFAAYAFDAEYANDSTQASIMSYFDQIDNTFINASYAPIITPMIADVIAITDLYGVTGVRNVGDTTYGNNSTQTGFMSELERLADRSAFTIVDDGGIDTINLSLFDDTQRIDIRQEAISDIAGLIGNMSIARGTIIENVIGGSGDEVIIGNAFRNTLEGRAGNDRINGGNDFDTIRAGLGNDTVWGGNGRDTVFLNQGDDTYIDNAQGGYLGADFVLGGFGNDTIQGGNGDDRFYGEWGNDTVWGRLGNDELGGGDGRDLLNGGDGNDRLLGGNGDDTLNGGNGRDVLAGGAGADVMTGGAGSDVYFVDTYADRIIENGGEGFDQVIAGYSLEMSRFSQLIDRGTLSGTADLSLGGNARDNLLNGNAGNNAIRGNFGDDTIFGAGGNDDIGGGAGNDRLHGNAGNDRLTGADGADVFVFETGFGRDRITDFDVTGGDRIDLGAVGAITSYADLVDHHLVERGGFAAIRVGDNQVVLEGVRLEELTQNDFQFLF